MKLDSLDHLDFESLQSTADISTIPNDDKKLYSLLPFRKTRQLRAANFAQHNSMEYFPLLTRYELPFEVFSKSPPTRSWCDVLQNEHTLSFEFGNFRIGPGPKGRVPESWSYIVIHPESPLSNFSILRYDGGRLPIPSGFVQVGSYSQMPTRYEFLSPPNQPISIDAQALCAGVAALSVSWDLQSSAGWILLATDATFDPSSKDDLELRFELVKLVASFL